MATKTITKANILAVNTALDTNKTTFQDATGAQTYIIQAGAKAAITSSNGGDTVAFAGSASDYEIKISGRTISFKDSDGVTATINIKGTVTLPATTTVLFSDGSVDLVLEKAGKATIDGVKITNKYSKDIASKMTPDDSVTTSVDVIAANPVDASGAPVATNLGQVYALTANVDAITGTANNDTFNGTGASFLSALDTLDGAGGTDVLNILDTNALAIAASVSVSNIETANIKTASTIGGSTATWAGLTALNVTLYGGTTAKSDLKAAATTAVTVTDLALAAGDIEINGGSTVTVTATGDDGSGNTIKVGGTTAAAGAVSVTNNISSTATTAADITVTGGTTVTVTQNVTSTTVAADETAGAVIVNGNKSTTAVTATATKAVANSATVAGVVNSSVEVVDVNNGTTTAGTITSVTANGYTTLDVKGSALTTLSVANGSGNITIANGDAITTKVTTLSMTANGLTGGTLDDADVYTTLNIATTGAASTLKDITSTNVKTLAITGDKVLTITDASASLNSLASVTVAGSAGLSANLSNEASVTSFVSTSTGANTLTLANTAVTITGGAGTDSVTLTGAIGATAKIDLGAGADKLTLSTGASTKGATITGGADTDTLVVGDGDWIDGVVAYTSFEIADISGVATTTALNMDNLASATSIVASAALVGDIAITNVAANTTLSISTADADVATTQAISMALKTDTATDTMTLNLSTVDSAAKAVSGKGDNSVTNEVTVASLTVDNIETLTIDASVTNIDGGAGATAGTHTASEYVHVVTSLTDADLTTLVYKGAASLKVADVTATLLTKVDASAATGKLTIALDASANTGAVAVLGGSAADTITMTSNVAANNIIQANGGADIITLAASGTKETVKIATDTDSVLTLTDTTSPVVTPVVMDTVTGYDNVTNFITGQDKLELAAALGLGTGDARTAITGKATIGDGTITDNAELAGIVQTLIGTGTGFFNDGTTNRAIAQVVVNDTTDFTIVFVDTNNDGNFTSGTDQAVQLTGLTTGIILGDVVFG